jgi:hypothetical protein
MPSAVYKLVLTKTQLLFNPRDRDAGRTVGTINIEKKNFADTPVEYPPQDTAWSREKVFTTYTKRLMEYPREMPLSKKEEEELHDLEQKHFTETISKSEWSKMERLLRRKAVKEGHSASWWPNGNPDS